jgi:hypothetical protein
MKALNKIFGLAAIAACLCPFAVFAADSLTVGSADSLSSIGENLDKVVLIATGVYEVVSRVIPTTKDVTIIGNVLRLLSFISQLFNKKKK